jgi:rRNA maturation endonuclease Nob1
VEVIELVCPKCGAQNEDKNFYCFNCGNKLRRRPPNTPIIGEPIKIETEPGSIKVEGEKVVAHVMICPRCNKPNKETDKFCYSCGKKLKSETLKEKKARSSGK